MKKTALDDNAAIYQADTQTRRQKWEQMDAAQKIQYFCNYYLMKTLAAAALCGVVIFLAYTIFFRPRERYALRVAVVDEVLDRKAREALERELTEYMGLDEADGQILIDDSFYMSEDGLSKLEVYLSAQAIDVIIAGEDVFRQFAGYGFYQDLEEILPQELCARCSADFAEAAGYLELETETDGFVDRETGQGEALPYGVRLGEESRWHTKVGAQTKQAVFGIAQGTKNKERACQFLEFIL